ncbi:MAG: transporter related protein [Panacagrimonas sp.]|jgi:putative ABC transport system ATP-binding protein|nr:ABC transporter ATP-binding protein [Panacagrimonas sp.]MCC2657881.1 transporter related protein [Panacagrimonas sp.]
MAGTSGDLIRVEGLAKDYVTAAGAFPALRGVDLRIDEREFVAIMGPSGSGKSTFMNLLGCLDSPTRGRYWLDGRDVAGLPTEQLARVRNQQLGFVFQGFNLLQRASVIDNVALPLVYAGVPRAERQARARVLIERVGLGRYADSLPSRISGGQQQRVAIARALVNRPRVILADEPTGNLDSHTTDEVMALFAELNREEGITLVLVTHESDVAEYARRVIRFHDGLVVEDRVQTPREPIEIGASA